MLQNTLIPFINDSYIGQERIGSHLSIAVDLRAGQSSTVYVAWADVVGTSQYTLHVRRSTDRGQTWSPNDLLTIRNAVNPALAVNSNGKIGFLHQQLTGPFKPKKVSAAVYQRSHDFTQHKLFGVDGATPVDISIDPFFFKVTE